jgi:hypothetical protein
LAAAWGAASPCGLVMLAVTAPAQLTSVNEAGLMAQGSGVFRAYGGLACIRG